jgi:hypothetical protein
LRPKIYSQITTRLITVVILAYLIQALFSEFENRYVWALSFLAGVVPTTVLRKTGHLLSSLAIRPNKPREERWSLGRAFADTFASPRALTQLDGVDLYESTRLETEGITDIPSLAKADLVSVMVSTRLPVERLVDWMDQAVLLLLLDGADSEEPDDRVKRLRTIGIRTASAVLEASRRPGHPVHRAAERIISTPFVHRDTTREHAISEATFADTEVTKPAGGSDAPVGDGGAGGQPTSAPAGGAVDLLTARADAEAPSTNGDTRKHAGETAGSGAGDACSLALLAAEIRREPAMSQILQWYRSKDAEDKRPCPTLSPDTLPASL